MAITVCLIILVLTVGVVELASPLDQVGDDEILMVTKHNGVDEVTISRQAASWIHSAGSFGSEGPDFGVSRKLAQAIGMDTGEIINEQMVGNDSRTSISQTQRYPWRAIGHLETRRAGLEWEQDSGRCSGALIGPRHVLTSAHCLWDINSNAWYMDFRFIPGRAGKEKPYGTIGWRNASIPIGWDKKVIGHDKFDYGLLELNEDVGDRTGWFSFGYDCSEIAYRLNIAGYPGDVQEGTYMFYTYCESIYLDACLSKGAADLYRHFCDTAPGMSGGPMWTLNPMTQIREIRGVHKGSTGISNLGIYISENLFSFIEEKMDESNVQASTDNLQDTRVVAATDTQQLTAPITEIQATEVVDTGIALEQNTALP